VQRSSSPKERLDQLLISRKLAESRTRAQALIMAGKVVVKGLDTVKPGTRIPLDAEIAILTTDNPYVSRGGLKLENFLQEFPFAVEGATVADLGASTGGFTDCLLQRGARRVFALDVGAGQLHQQLRTDPRVVTRERTNARNLGQELFGEALDLLTIDVSFISLTRIIPCLQAAAGGGPCDLLALIKPQFEAGRAETSRGSGVIRDPAIHRRVLGEIWDFLVAEHWRPLALAAANPPGSKGNQEYMIGATTASCPRTPPFSPPREREEWLARVLAGKESTASGKEADA
jgi:23S rRNA (cytidine1920-2'-O)/16S rRNA (cytidine1409-2'-O)-methyltransferase